MSSAISEALKKNPRAAIDLALISFVSLYLELLIIRWLSSEIRIFAYFKNIPLLACLFGLGLGMALSGSKRKLFRFFPICFALLAAIISFAEPLNLVHVTFINPLESYLPGDFINESVNAGGSMINRLKLFVPGLLLLIGIFYLIVLTFTALGQRLGQLLDEFEPLVAYSINVFASILGIGAFTMVSAYGWRPEYWVLLGIVIAAWFYRKAPVQILVLCIAFAIPLLFTPKDIRWSPYYRLSLTETVLPGDEDHPPAKYGYDIRVNYDSIQGAYDNSPETLAKLSDKQRKIALDYYDTPYAILEKPPGSVLILAAGSGNDVAAALRAGAEKIDAVDIDPEIVNIGKELHPEKPYANKNVHVYVDDARSFMSRSDKQYDLIVFSYLDSHTALSSMSSIRLDNYVYTVESFKSARKLLKADGVMAVTFYSLTHWQLARVLKTLEQAFGYEPIGVYSPNGNGPCFLLGSGVNRDYIVNSGLKLFDKDKLAEGLSTENMTYQQVVPTSDDWPFFFLRNRGMSWMYGIGLFFTLCIGWLMLKANFQRISTTTMGKTMFCLGAAFMLVEIRGITQMGLLMGTTWLVNSAVIGAILIMILAATVTQIKYRFTNIKLLYALLIVSLLVCFFTPMSALNSLPFLPRISIGSAILTVPVLFAAVIFAITLSHAKETSDALAMNLLGTLFGGVLEYLSMALGINSMNLLAAALYITAFLFWTGQTKPVAKEPA